MIIDCSYQNPTRIHFGRTALSRLPKELANFGPNVLLVYGKASIKVSGLYDIIIEMLRRAEKTVVELPGINSNPRYSQVLDGANIVRDHNVDLILAVGGGSVIDCAKAISASAYSRYDSWQHLWINKEPLTSPVVPIGAVLTMAGTGSEMNAGSVITNEAKKIKMGRVFPLNLLAPRFSILNPELTYTVPHIQMVSGIFDTFSHLMEQYCSGTDDNTTDYMIEGVMRSLVHSARIAIKNPRDYEARSNIMWCATVGLNKLLSLSKEEDWEVHMIEHQLGAYTDCPHGVGLAIISPAYYRYIYKAGLQKFVRFARTIWEVNDPGLSDEQTALEGIRRMELFIRELGIPATLREVGTTRDMLPKIAKSAVPGGGYMKLEADDIQQILEACF